MYDNPPHFAALSSSPLDTTPLDTDVLPTDVLPTATLHTDPRDPAAAPPPALDPELVDLADPELEVLVSVQPAFVQRAAVPFDVGTLADAGVLMDVPPPGGQPAGRYG